MKKVLAFCPGRSKIPSSRMKYFNTCIIENTWLLLFPQTIHVIKLEQLEHLPVFLEEGGGAGSLCVVTGEILNIYASPAPPLSSCYCK